MTFSAVLVLGQSYGGECILRVFLYALAGCSVLLATAVAGALSHRESIPLSFATDFMTLEP